MKNLSQVKSNVGFLKLKLSRTAIEAVLDQLQLGRATKRTGIAVVGSNIHNCMWATVQQGMKLVFCAKFYLAIASDSFII